MSSAESHLKSLFNCLSALVLTRCLCLAFQSDQINGSNCFVVDDALAGIAEGRLVVKASNSPNAEPKKSLPKVPNRSYKAKFGFVEGKCVPVSREVRVCFDDDSASILFKDTNGEILRSINFAHIELQAVPNGSRSERDDSVAVPSTWAKSVAAWVKGGINEYSPGDKLKNTRMKNYTLVIGEKFYIGTNGAPEDEFGGNVVLHSLDLSEREALVARIEDGVNRSNSGRVGAIEFVAKSAIDLVANEALDCEIRRDP